MNYSYHTTASKTTIEYFPAKGYNKLMIKKQSPSKKVGGKQRKSTCSSIKTTRSVHKSTSFSAAKQWDILQQISLTPEQRQRAARELKERVFGKHAPDIRASHTGR